jgi:hypothetical protein
MAQTTPDASFGPDSSCVIAALINKWDMTA